MAEPQISQISQTQTTIPDYARPFVENLLGDAQSLTDTTANPYMQYMGDRVAQFTPLQQQAYQNAGLMQAAPQLQDATALAGMAGLGALNTQYTFNPSNFNSAFSGATTRDAQGNVSNSMLNPYMQSIVDIQQREAERQAGIAGTNQQAAATKSGAFGGGRDAIMRAEAARNLATQKGDIQAMGLNNAYQQAMQQYNTQNQQNAQQQQFGAGLGLQGLQTANQAAQNLGNLGNTQYQQNMGINQMQNQYGGQQQQQLQNILNNQYQDFQNYQNYPYKQMGFMSDMLRGLPLTQQASTVYQQAPSLVSQAAGLGTAALGASKLGMFAKGGAVSDRPAGLAELALYNMG
jgi:hypothetical protein